MKRTADQLRKEWEKDHAGRKWMVAFADGTGSDWHVGISSDQQAPLTVAEGVTALTKIIVAAELALSSNLRSAGLSQSEITKEISNALDMARQTVELVPKRSSKKRKVGKTPKA